MSLKSINSITKRGYMYLYNYVKYFPSDEDCHFPLHMKNVRAYI